MKRWSRRQHWSRRGLLVVAALVAVVVCAGCDSAAKAKVAPSATTATTASSASTPSSTPVVGTSAQSKYAALYLQILGPADEASGKFFSALKALPANATGAQAQTIATPAAEAISTADQRLSRVSWPHDVASAVGALILVDARLVGDLGDLGPLSHVTSGGWNSRFERDVSAVSTRVAVVVSDLQRPIATK